MKSAAKERTLPTDPKGPTRLTSERQSEAEGTKEEARYPRRYWRFRNRDANDGRRQAHDAERVREAGGGVDALVHEPQG